MKSYWLLAEPETFFLPNLAARLATHGHLQGIIEIKFESSVTAKTRRAIKIFRTFGMLQCVSIVIASIIAHLVDAGDTQRFYSLKKVSKKFKLPYIKCRGFNDPSLHRTLEQTNSLILVQVSRLVPAQLTHNYPLLNKHCSLLPSYAGVLPVFWAKLEDAPLQGVTVHRMNEEFDGGACLAQTSVSNQGSVWSLTHKLYDHTATLLETLDFKPDRAQQPESSSDVDYRSFPQAEDRKEFLRKGNTFGWIFRLHPRHRPLTLNPGTES